VKPKAKQSDKIDIVYCGNPLIDITQDDQEKTLLEKYGLKVGMASLATPEQLPLIEEVWKLETKKLTLGGAALNSARGSAYWFKKSGTPGKVVYFGGLGSDEIGGKMKDMVTESGVTGNFYESTDTQTGVCACLVTGIERTLCVNLGAAKKYPTAHIESNLETLNNAAMIYATGFFLDSNQEAFGKVMTHASANNIAVGINFSATFLIEIYLDLVKENLKHADYVFCNEDESSVFAEKMGLKAEDRQGCAKIVAEWEKSNTKRPRVVIMTQGPEATIVATSAGNGEAATIELIEVAPVAKESIVDTNGCGDAFVAAFNAAITRGKTVTEAVHEGNKLGGQVLCVQGAQYLD